MSFRRNTHVILIVVTIIAIAALACNTTNPARPRVVATATLVPTATPALPPLPPVLVTRAPDRGEEQPVTSPVVLTFNEPMDRTSVESAFQVSPAVQGSLRWDDDKTVRFVPEGSGFARDANYEVKVTESAKAQNGLALQMPISIRFKAVGFLEVSQVLPQKDTQDVAPDAVITVMFNRPVVPLVAVSEQDKLPKPLTFDPPATGRGEWLNTSIYVFHPDGLTPGTTYTAKVAAGLQDVSGAVLQKDFSWSFSVRPPLVVKTLPGNQERYVDLTVPISVTFNQPMDHTSAQAAFSLRAGNATGEKIQGTFQWMTNTLGFVPSRRLDLDKTYYASVAAGAKSAVGSAGTRKDYAWTFQTVPYPRILSTRPADGDKNADPSGSFEIVFSAPIDPATVMRNIYITPELKATDVYTYYSRSDRRFVISFDRKPSTDYTINIVSRIADPYGNQLGRDASVKFTTRALEPSVYLNVPGQIGTYSAYTDTKLYAVYRNIATMNFALSRMSLNEFWQVTKPDGWEQWNNYQPAPGAVVRQWSVPAAQDVALNETAFFKAYLAGDTGGTLRVKPGLYYLEVSSPQVGKDNQGGPAKHILIVGSANVTFKMAEREALVWATDLQSGQPLPNTAVTIYDDAFQPLASGKTDKDGLFAAKWDNSVDVWRTTYAVVGEAGSDVFGLALSGWSDGIGPWDFNIDGRFYSEPYNVYFTTDRPIYRPGQTVFFKAILRLDDDARYKLFKGQDKLPILVSDPEGKEVFSDTLAVNGDMATINGQFKLSDQAALGNYQLRTRLPWEGGTPPQPNQAREYGIGFLVAAYVRPEFLVNVTTDKPAYVQGDKINVDVQSTYYFGGPVSDAQVDWNVQSEPYYFEYQGQGNYDWADTDYFYGASPRYGGNTIASGTGKTDSTGHFVVPVKADLGKNDNSQKFTIEANITDINDRVVSNRVDAIVHQGMFYIGLSPERYVGKVGEKQPINIKTVDWDSKDYGQANLTVVFYQREWFNVQEQTPGGPVWTVTFSDTAVATQTVTTDASGLAVASFTPDQGGTYRIIATGKDSKDNRIRSGTYLWVTSGQYVSWRQENNDRIQLVADKRSYSPGETASILIPSPFQGQVTALVTVERGRILSKQVIQLKSNSDVLKLTITPDMAPNAYVSVVLAKGVDKTTPIAAFKVGYAAFAVSTTQQELKVSLSTDRDPATSHYAPRDTVTYTVQATDYAGKPVQAELSLAVVDLSVLSLVDPNSPPIVEGFYGKRGLGVRTASTLVLSVDRLNVKLQTEVKGGGGGLGAAEGEFAPRQQFYDTAFWSATTRTDASGKAQVQVVLPDNLTTWRMTAKAVTADTLVGENKLDIISTKDLLIRPVTPRFFVVGDKSTVAAVVNNNTTKALNVDVRLEAQGVTIGGQAAQKVTVPAQDKVRIEWQVEVQDAQSANLVFSVSGGGLSDASKPPVGLPPDQRLPIYRYSTPETVATAGTLDQVGDRLEVVALPPNVDTTQGDLTVQIDPSLAAGMTDGLTWLENYPYECAEQTVSRFLPNMLTFRALKKLNLTTPELEDNLKEQVSVGLQRLYGLQHADGGWGWWVNDKSNATTTAWVALGMIKAQEAGFAVDAQSLNRALDYLNAQLVSPTTLKESSQANMQAFILYVTAEAGRNNLSRAVALYDGKRDLLDSYGRAYLALALGLWQKNDRSRVDSLLSDINNAAITSATGVHWEEKTKDWWNWNTDTRSTAIILDLLARFDVKNQLAPNVVRWLMVARTAGHWETTQETAWALIALTDWMDATGELKADYAWKVDLNTYTLGEGTANRDTVKQSTTLNKAVADLLRDQGNALVISRSTNAGQSGEGRLYYSAYLKTYIPVEDVRSLSRGVVVARQYFRTDDPCFSDPKKACTPVTSATVGDVLQVKLSIVAPNDLYYVVVEDPLPAGTEAIDTSLKTTSQVGQAPKLSRVNPDDPFGGYDGWGWWWFSQTEMRDEKVVLFATRLPKGAYEYTYMLRAGLAGEFKVMPSVANEMYFPEVFGRSDGTVFTISK
jgi:alpha-2-macroglobulin